jgi:hypothetical protein
MILGLMEVRESLPSAILGDGVGIELGEPKGQERVTSVSIR